MDREGIKEKNLKIFYYIRPHKDHYWPQYFQLMDALDLPELKQPEMKV